MYRIRRESGEEVTFGSIDELGAAVVAGVVTAKAEIFHARAEKWLPIASHPHFKMAHDRINSASAPKASGQRPALGASGRRPALGASGQRPALNASGQRPAITAPQAGAAPANTESVASQNPAPRWNSAQRPAARAVAPKPSAPPAPSTNGLRLVRGDARPSGAATAPALPEVEFELLPALEAPAIIEPIAVEPAATEPAAVEPIALDPVVERSPAAVELVSHEQQPIAMRGEVEIINPDRTMPVVPDREIPPLEIPAPIRDFTPADVVAEPVAKSSRAPLFIGLGLVAAAAAAIAFFVFKPSSAAPAAPSVSVAKPAPAPVSPAPVAAQPAPEVSPPPVVTTKPPTGASTGLGGDVQPRKPKRQSSDEQTASKATVGDGLEPPPDALPAAPSLGNVGDAAALPTVEAGATSGAADRTKALEKTRREIDSSMRR